jgi:glycosyltransferase involved in cell wall biosynthesis
MQIAEKVKTAADSQTASRKILFVQYTNPAAYPPLEHSSRILANSGWKVLFLGTGSLGADSLCFPPHEHIEVRQLPFCQAGWRQKLHYIRFMLWVFLWTLRWRPDWVYASDLLSCPAAWLLNLLPSVRVIYHEHDSPSASYDRFFQRLCLKARQRLAKGAEMCILPNQPRVESFIANVGKTSSDGSRPVNVVWNCPSIEEISSPRPACDEGDLWVLYHGSIVPSRLPLSVLKALSLLPENVKLRVIGYETVGHRGYLQELQETSKRLGIIHRIELIGTVAERKTLLEWCRKCDIGLSFMPKQSNDINLNAMVGASNKPFDYLSCGLALLVSDLPDWRQMYVDSGYGLACDPDDPESLAAALRWFLDHLNMMREMGERGRQKILAEWNYETQFDVVYRKVCGC